MTCIFNIKILRSNNSKSFHGPHILSGSKRLLKGITVETEVHYEVGTAQNTLDKNIIFVAIFSIYSGGLGALGTSQFY